MLSGMTETAFSALAGIEIVNPFKAGADYRNEYHLRDSRPGRDYEWRLAAVPARDENLPLVIGINKPGEVAENDTVFVAEAGARQDDCR